MLIRLFNANDLIGYGSSLIQCDLCTEVHGGAQRCEEGMQWCTDRYTEGLVKVYRGIQRLLRGMHVAHRCMEGSMEVHRRCTKVGKGTQRCTEMHGGMHRFAEACTEVC